MICELAIAASMHLLPGDWNEVHPTARCDHGRYFAAAYLNSEDRASVAVGASWQWGNVFADAALVTGYSAADVVPMLRLGVENDTFRAFIAPAATESGEIGAVIGIETVLIRF